MQPEVVRIILSGTEFRNDAAQLHSHNVHLPLQLQVCKLCSAATAGMPTLLLCLTGYIEGAEVLVLH